MSLRTAYRGGYQDRPGWHVTFDYDADLIDRLKRAVPARDRSYDGASHQWWFAAEYEDVLVRHIRGFESHLAQGQLL